MGNTVSTLRSKRSTTPQTPEKPSQKRSDFSMMPNSLLDDTSLSEKNLVGLLRLIRLYGNQKKGETRRVFVGSIRQLATKLKMARMTVHRMLPVLIAKGYITRTENAQGIMKITLLIDTIWDKNTAFYAQNAVPSSHDISHDDCPSVGQNQAQTSPKPTKKSAKKFGTGIVPIRPDVVPESPPFVPSWDDSVPSSSTNEGGNTSSNILANTSSPNILANTSSPNMMSATQHTMRQEAEGEGGVIKESYLLSLTTFLSSKKREEKFVPSSVEVFPIAIDTIGHSEMIVDEQRDNDYTKEQTFVIATEANIPASWTLAQMEQWFASLPHALPSEEYQRVCTKIDAMHRNGLYTPRDIVLTYGYMRYFDPHWSMRVGGVNIRSVADRMCAKNGERTCIPDERILSAMGITLTPFSFAIATGEQDVQEVQEVQEVQASYPTTIGDGSTDASVPVIAEFPAGTQYAQQRSYLQLVGSTWDWCDIWFEGQWCKGGISEWDVWIFEFSDTDFLSVYEAVLAMGHDNAQPEERCDDIPKRTDG